MLGLNDAGMYDAPVQTGNTMLRWEPSKEDRRQGTGRREHDQIWDAIRSKQ